MLLRVIYPRLDFDQYLPLLSPQLATDLTNLAQEVRHLRFVHVNSTTTGGGVAEIIQSLAPLMNSLGIQTERMVITPPPEFFLVTKRIHNLLQGAEGGLSSDELEIYFNAIQGVADEIRSRSLAADVWFLHDPQLLPLARLLAKESHEARIWVCHIDLTAPNRSVMDTLQPMIEDYDSSIFSLPTYVPSALSEESSVHITPPAIDALTAKNTPLSGGEALGIVAAMGIDPGRPLVTQVSRFDLWKDPWGVIDAYRMARESVPGLQLALLGLSQATDDPEALDVLNSVTSHAAQDPDIHLYFFAHDLPASIDEIVNAFQVAAQVVIQKSTREGFGLTVSEAMWKGKPVIGGNVGGIRVQIEDGVSGYLVDSAEACAERLVMLLQDSGLRERIGAAARDRVSQLYLLPRLALNYLQAVKANLPESVRNNGANGKAPNPFEALETLVVEPAPVNGAKVG